MLKGEVKPYEAADVSDEGYPDGLTAKLAVQKLDELAANGKPFFLGVGFFKPHLPFNAPRKYWDLYDESRLPIAAMADLPVNVHRESLQESGEFGGYKKGDEKASLDRRVSDAYSRKLRHAYYACVSYMDAQVGRVLDKLKETGLDKNTIVVLWGDHGWHLGEDRVWGKHTLSEWSLRSPFIVKLPGSTKGSVSENIISSVDIYPTIMELCGIKSPEKIDGKSHAEMIKKNTHPKKNLIAYSYFNNGITCRTDRYRLTRYFRKAEPVLELYDYLKDPNETRNIAGDNPDVVKKLLPLLEKGNNGIYPMGEVE
jgi:arylsulfatase A-like enzyme